MPGFSRAVKLSRRAVPLVASFDKKFLSEEFRRAGQKSLQRNKPFCTMKRLQQQLREFIGTLPLIGHNVSSLMLPRRQQMETMRSR